MVTSITGNNEKRWKLLQYNLITYQNTYFIKICYMNYILKVCGSQLWQDLSFHSSYKVSCTNVGDLSEFMSWCSLLGNRNLQERSFGADVSSLKVAQTRWSQVSNANYLSFPKAKVQILQSPPCTCNLTWRIKTSHLLNP